MHGTCVFFVLFATHRSFRATLLTELKAASDRLILEIERTSSAAKSKTVQLAKEQHSNPGKTSARLLAIELIQTHNRVDVYQLIYQSNRLILENSSKLPSSKSIPFDKELIIAMTNIVYGASRLALFELEALASLFQRMYGKPFVEWARNNRGGTVNERVVTKLTKQIEGSLVNQYLNTITKPSSAGKAENVPVAVAVTGTKAIGGSGAPRTSKSKHPGSSKFPNESKQDHQSSTTSSVVSMSNLAPTLPIRIIRPNQRLEIAFDVRTKNPVYVMERLDGLARRKATIRHAFFEEERLPLEYRSRLCSFFQSGFDRGHMAAAANFGSESVRDTFNLCNVSPQDQAMNRSTWVKLENWCRKVAEQELQSPNTKQGKSVHIVTGPVWLPVTSPTTMAQSGGQQHQFEFSAIGKGDSLVHVPTHFFKIIVVSDNVRILKFACFLVPNLKQKAGTSLEEYIVHWDRLEATTGLQFFPNLATPKWKVDARKVTASMLSSKSNDRVVSLAAQLEHLRI
jgi:endonuclease G